MRTLTVICPVYNEQEVIEAFYTELKNVLANVSSRYISTILFVVDRCPDRSLEILKKIAALDSAVQIIALSARFGHQMSLLAGIDHAHTDAVVMMDSDLQHPPDLIPRLLEEFEKGYDIVYTLREDSPEINFFKRTSSKLFYRIINKIADVPINESAADFRLVSRRVIEVFQNQIRERNQFLRGLFGWVGFNSIGIAFKVRKRGAGKSKYSITRMIRFGADGVISFSKSPLQAAAYIGFALASLGFIFALVIVIQYFFSSHFPSGWATVTVLILIFSGTQLIFMGILGEYISAIFDEVKARPHYIVQEKVNFPNPLTERENTNSQSNGQ
jgi:glycosyltransferase involved in cell wall biosynthesis